MNSGRLQCQFVGGGQVRLCVIDAASGAPSLSIVLSATDFLRSVGGSQPDCQFEIAAHVGLVTLRESRPVRFRTFSVAVNVEAALRPQEVDGWRAEVGNRSWDDVQRLCPFVNFDGEDTVLNVTFVRFDLPEGMPS